MSQDPTDAQKRQTERFLRLPESDDMLAFVSEYLRSLNVRASKLGHIAGVTVLPTGKKALIRVNGYVQLCYVVKDSEPSPVRFLMTTEMRARNRAVDLGAEIAEGQSEPKLPTNSITRFANLESARAALADPAIQAAAREFATENFNLGLRRDTWHNPAVVPHLTLG